MLKFRYKFIFPSHSLQSFIYAVGAQYKFGVNKNILSKGPSRFVLDQHTCMFQIFCKHRFHFPQVNYQTPHHDLEGLVELTTASLLQLYLYLLLTSRKLYLSIILTYLQFHRHNPFSLISPLPLTFSPALISYSSFKFCILHHFFQKALYLTLL